MHTAKISGSSNIAQVEWDNSTLFITFTKGTKYKFEGPTLSDYKSLISAASVGGYFAANIKPRFKGVPV